MARAIAWVVVLGLGASSGCFSTWLATQATGNQRGWDERVREETVPLPGIQERLTIRMPLAIEYEPTSSTTTTTTSTSTTPPPGAKPIPFGLACAATQSARDEVYRSAFRYGGRWKKGTAVSFVVEAALASAFLLTVDSAKPQYLLYGGFFALDALGTAAVFFIPRKEIFDKHERGVTTRLRSDCPDGLTLEIGGDTFVVDAAGRIGELGELALADWMQAPTGRLLLGFEGRVTELPIGVAEQCAWQRARDPQHAPACSAYHTGAPRSATVTLEVPAGTLTNAAPPAVATP